jgi:Leucine-rich repeat (LRR) protein
MMRWSIWRRLAYCGLLVYTMTAQLPVVKATCIGNISSVEYNALEAFYDSTNGEGWLVSNDARDAAWSFPSALSAPCATVPWEGLTCNNTGIDGLCYLYSMVMRSYPLKGSLPSALGSLTGLTSIDFNFNSLIGTIPESLGNLTNLAQLSMAYNKLSGAPPASLFQIPNLEQLNFANNLLSGQVPSYIGDGKKILTMQLESNYFSGSLPSSVYRLYRLISFQIEYNYVTGTISSSLDQMLALSSLGMYYNYFTGAIPSQLGLVHHLEACELYSNFLTQTIPSELGQLHVLAELSVNNNLLSGRIPSQMGNATFLIQLVLSGNSLSGMIPKELAHCSMLTTIELSNNGFSGVIPDEIWTIANLEYFIVSNNYLQGTISESIRGMARLNALEVSYNLITGPLPDALGNLTTLHEFAAAANQITGPLVLNPVVTDLENFNVSYNLITSSLPDLTSLIILRSFSLSANYVTGSIPDSITSIRFIQSIDFGTNFMSGTLTSGIGQLGQLQSFNVSGNSFSGQLVNMFEQQNGTLRLLEYFDVSSNALGGPIPPSLFQPHAAHLLYTSLKVVVMFSNCFTGTLPPAICGAGNLSVLILDSVSSTDACDERLAPMLRALFKVQISLHHLQGSIPDCMWSMPSLTTVHLSGTGLGGTLSDISNEDSVLNDVALASNAIVGSIPGSWQQRKWKSLDLSGNKLSGILHDSFIITNDTALKLDVNRLSGYVPSSFKYATNINVLNGNLFNCGEGSKPVNDPSADEYVCGSDDFNDALLTWSILIALFVSVCVWRVQGFAFYLYQLYGSVYDEIANRKFTDKHLAKFVDMLHHLLVVNMVLTAGYLFVSMMTYIAMKEAPTDLAKTFSTHSVQYLWQTTAAFLHNITPTVMILLFLYASVVVLGFTTRLSNEVGVQQRSRFVSMMWHCRVYPADAARVVLMFVLHIVITVGVNVLYVVALLHGVSGAVLLALQLALSVFKLLWNNVVVRTNISGLKMAAVPALFCSAFLQLFTFIAGPVIATFLSDNSCFRYVLTGQPAVDSSFQVSESSCVLFCDPLCRDICAFSSSSLTIVTSVTPPWLYSYQCSSILLVNYTPVFLFSYAISGILSPVSTIAYLGYIGDVLRQRLANRFDITKVTRDTLWMLTLPKELDKLSPVDSPIHDNEQTKRLQSDFVKPQTLQPRVFNSVNLMSKMCMNIGVMLTFGLASPLLALAICVDTVAVVFMFMYMVRRFISFHISADGTFDHAKEAWMRIEQCTQEAVSGIHSVVWVILAFVSVFWSLFVFDMIGDVYGAVKGGVTVLLPTLGLYSLLWFVGFYNDRSVRAKERKSNADDSIDRSIFVSIELRTNETFIHSLEASTG